MNAGESTKERSRITVADPNFRESETPIKVEYIGLNGLFRTMDLKNFQSYYIFEGPRPEDVWVQVRIHISDHNTFDNSGTEEVTIYKTNLPAK